MPSQTQIEIDRNGSCFLCIGSSGEDSKSSCHLKPSTPFKMLLRYLNIDFSSTLWPARTNLTCPREVDFAVSLCSRCSSMLRHFLKLYQEFEMIQMELDYCVWKLHQSIQGEKEKTDGCNENLEGHVKIVRLDSIGSSVEDAVNVDLIGKLRKETLEKCAHRLASSTPRILIRENADLLVSQKVHNMSSDGMGEEAMNNSLESLETGDSDICMDLDPDNPDQLSPSPSSSPPPPEQPKRLIVIVRETDAEDANSSPVSKITETEIISPDLSSQLHKCPHCNISTRTRCELRMHLSMVHPLQHFSHRLPGRTTEEQLQSAVSSLLAKKRVIDVNHNQGRHRSRVVLGCPLCSSITRDAFSLRRHIFRLHFEQVIRKLPKTWEAAVEENNESTPIPGPTATEMPVGTISSDGDDNRCKILRSGKIQCLECGKIFIKNAYFRRHYHFAHRKSPSSCPHCGEIYSRNNFLREHVATEHTLLAFKDKLPSETSDGELREAMKALVWKETRVSPGVKGMYISPRDLWGCSNCDREFVNYSGIRAHIFQSHLDQVVRFVENLRGAIIKTEDIQETFSSSSSTNYPLQLNSDLQMTEEEDEATLILFKQGIRSREWETQQC